MDKELREKVSEILHDEWVTWSKRMAEELRVIRDHIINGDTDNAINVIDERIAAFKEYQIPYSELDEDIKDEDRLYADKTIRLLRKLAIKEV